MNWTKQMVLQETIEMGTDAVAEGVFSNGHRNGAVPESADVPSTPIDHDLLRSEIKRHLEAIGLNGSRSHGTLSKDAIRDIHRFHRDAAQQRIHRALGVRFKGERGTAFFRSSLVQTLFYGVFSACVLWARQTSPPTGSFSWREAVWHLRAPVLRALFQQLSDPGRLRPLGLVELLDWTAAALDRVERDAFFDRFNQGEAVPYCYEPFLEAFDPELRKQLGVWYTPADMVRYMVARVDRALKDDLGIADGLAAENVYVLDPCCGTGAYLAEVLRRIAANLEAQGLGALTGARVKQAATQRVFGFGIMPAPFVVAHLQVGLTMQDLDAPLSEDGTERASIFLTNALTGWEPRESRTIPFPELEEERDRAEQVKQEAPVLVILGNPPYNRYPGVGIDEERELTLAYRATRRVRLHEKKALNDLYVRFFRMAERRIAERTGQGVVCFISNYSWLDGLAFAGMRERYLEAFDAIRIDNLNGDKYRTGKTTPDGSPDPSIFSTSEDPVGIQVGTAITTLVRKADHAPIKTVGFRHLWGQKKREVLTATAESEPSVLYDSFEPSLLLGLPFAETTVDDGWHQWPSLPDLFSISFSGANTKSTLVRHYPSLTDDPFPPSGAYAHFRKFCLDHEDEIRRIMATRLVQTNVVERCSYLLPAFALIAEEVPGTPLSLIDVGTSAGLSLLWDRYQYVYGGRIRAGLASSPVQIEAEVRGKGTPPIPHDFPTVAYRAGIDLHPVDMADPESALWLRALNWPEHQDRAAQLQAAIALVQHDAPELVEGDANGRLPADH